MYIVEKNDKKCKNICVYEKKAVLLQAFSRSRGSTLVKPFGRKKQYKQINNN